MTWHAIVTVYLIVGTTHYKRYRAVRLNLIFPFVSDALTLRVLGLIKNLRSLLNSIKSANNIASLWRNIAPFYMAEIQLRVGKIICT